MEIRPARRGRPKGTQDDKRGALLLAAAELLSGPDSPEITLRQVSLMAGVTPPLAHYYFTNREGLITALLEARVSPRIDELVLATQQHAAQPVAALSRLMQRLTLLASDRFLSRCLLMPAALPLRERLRALLMELLQAGQQAGQLRADLPPAYLAEALLSLCLFPMLDAHTADGLAAHAATLTLQHAALLQDGLRPARGARKHEKGQQ